MFFQTHIAYEARIRQEAERNSKGPAAEVLKSLLDEPSHQEGLHR